MAKLAHEPTELELDVAESLVAQVVDVALHMQTANPENCDRAMIMVQVIMDLQEKLKLVGIDPDRVTQDNEKTSR